AETHSSTRNLLDSLPQAIASTSYHLANVEVLKYCLTFARRMNTSAYRLINIVFNSPRAAESRCMYKSSKTV
ncbi:MAG: hypothetical protein Q9164_001611, partial [Protoblastenia rupestris]